MSRRTVVAMLTGAVLLGGLAGPAVANPLIGEESDGDGSTTVCLRLDSESGKRDGVCVWLPIDR